MNKKNKNKAVRLLVWIAIIEAIVIGGMVMAFLSLILDPIALATNIDTPTYDYAPVESDTKALAMSMTVAEITAHNGVDIDIEIPEAEVVEEVEEPAINWSEIIDVKRYARAPYNLGAISEGYVRPPLNDEVYKVVNGIPVTNRELHMLGLSMRGEANGQSMMEQAGVAWAILNRVDNADGENFARGHSITYVLQFPGYAPGQIHGYWNTKGAKCDDYWLMIAIDVVDRWALEWEGAEAEDVGRVLPKAYTYWAGKKTNGEWHNYFRTAYKTNEPRWDWSLPNPYVEDNNV